ncbi:chorismate mutase [Paraburkholderia sp. JPY681]|uniref:chorismate mutase n=2 Tax=Paraburkholderia atlantica TaxID=2654982 RepID=D5WNB8_PARAM|nr:chorismate mutase [Paraburkholderia atlantica]MBB5511111.1 chorismate mutase [Paraburkholderia atlantica]
MKLKKNMRRVCTRNAVTLALAVWLVTGCSAGAQQDAFLPLVRSMADRLNTADQVALNKWDTGQPVYDPQREAQVIANAVAMASEYGLTTEDVTNIFSDQIEANKEIQYELLSNWMRQGNAPATPRQSLAGVIRPILDKLQANIMLNLKGVAPLRSNTDCQTQVATAVGRVAQQTSLDALHLAALDRAVARICVTQTG